MKPVAGILPKARYRIRVAGREIEVPTAGIVIGRSGDCVVQLDGGLVSRRHAELRPVGDGLVITDLDSRNGVFVNQRKIAISTVLAHGDVVCIGVETIEVVDDHVMSRPAHLSTLPPQVAPAGEADVDAPEQVTVAATIEILSEREREVLGLIALGHTQREVAEKLHLSVKTVESHRARIAEKLKCQTRAELVSYAISAGLLTDHIRGR